MGTVTVWHGLAIVIVNSTLSEESAGEKVEDDPLLSDMVMVFWTLTVWVPRAAVRAVSTLILPGVEVS